jgi:hypothetical protein
MSLVLFTMFGASLVFAQAPTLDKLSFSNLMNNDCIVSAANKSISGTVIIPDVYGGRTVGAIPIGGFRDCTDITSVILPSLNNINLMAFDRCTSLISVTFLGPVNFANANAFPGDLVAKYRAANGGAGTYTRPRGSNTWTKQGGAVCPTCGQPLPR